MEGRDQRLVEEDKPFFFGRQGAQKDFMRGAVLAWGRPAPKGPKGLGIWYLRPFAIPFEEVSEI